MTGIWYIVGFAFAGVSFVFLTIGAAWLVSHRNRGDKHKGLPYESGIDTFGDTHGRFGLSFYIYALTHKDMHLSPFLVGFSDSQDMPSTDTVEIGQWHARDKWQQLGLPTPIRRLLAQTADRTA